MKGLRSCLSVVWGAVLIALALIAFAGPAAYVELAGRTATGVVTGRSERISVRYSEWSRTLRLEVRYTPADSDQPELASLPVSAIRYDSARVGDAIAVRYMPRPEIRALGEIAAPRLADQGPLGQLRARLEGAFVFLSLAGLFLALALAWQLTRRSWLLVPLGLLLLGAALYTVSDPPAPAPPGPQREAIATVSFIQRIDRLGRARGRGSDAFSKALQPYDVVALEFVPAASNGPVVAVDLVDANSVRGLELGAEVPIRYSTADPRWARVEGGQRTYAWKNLYGLGILAALILLLALGLWIGRRRARQRRSKLP